MYTMNLANANKDAVSMVGGKGANLGEMIQAGLPVPGGFCITSDAYRYYSRRHDQTGFMPADLRAEILQDYYKLGVSARVAVRSSATLEDLKEASFAGQQETYLNVSGEDELLKAVEDCFASLYNERAADYRSKSGYGDCPVAIAVVVQEMVESDMAGVMFTADPVANDRDRLLISASYGLGEAVVAGKVSPDLLVVDKAQQQIKRKVLGAKELSVRYGEHGSTIECPNSELLQKRFCLTDEQAARLAETGKQIEAHYGYPQDIEWAIRDDQIYILQARAITTLATEQRKSDQQELTELTAVERSFMELMNEFYPELPYPLELYTINESLQTAFGFDREQDAVYLDEMGRLAFKLPEVSFELDDEVQPDYVPEIDFARNMTRSEQIFGETRNLIDQIQELELSALSCGELQTKLQMLLECVRSILAARFEYNINPGFAVSKRIRELFKQSRLPYCEYDLLSGLSYKTSDMNLKLQQLAELINRHSGLKESMTAIKTEEFTGEVFGLLGTVYPEFGKQLDHLIRHYGWKSTNSHKSFSASAWNEDPTKLAVLLKIGVQGDNKIQSTKAYDLICREITASLPDQEAEELLQLTREFRQYHVNREESVYLLECIYGMCRCVLRALAAKFPQLLKAKYDILYLSMTEVMALNENSNQDQVLSLINVRKRQEPLNQSLWNSTTSGESEQGTVVLSGESGSAGTAAGEVCIINDISEFSRIKPGQILVCKYTDPMWTPLFTVASAIIAETGSVLSHAAIVAREYGIPAIMNCKQAMNILEDGQQVLVNGTTGKVHLVFNS